VRTFEFRDDKSAKFWNINLQGASFTVAFGRLGTSGQTQTKTFDDVSQAKKEHDKLVAEKLRKGYEETTGAAGAEAAPIDWSNFEGVCLGAVEYAGPKSWTGPKSAYRLRCDYDDEEDMPSKIRELAERPFAKQLRMLVIGAWGEGMNEGSDAADEIAATLLEVRESFPALRGLHFGLMDSEDCEISWINQADQSPLLEGFPDLEAFRVRGGSSLRFGKAIRHDKLRHLGVETGGLPRSALRGLLQCRFPELEHLELWLGSDNYGWDGGIEDLQPVLAGTDFPKLKRLCLRNSEIQDAVAAAVVNSPLLERIEVLDLSMGNLSDEGGRSLLRGLAGNKTLKRLVLDHHYLSDELAKELQDKLHCEVSADDGQESEDDWRSIMYSE
jgi:predicted DNA-binding WGR domain protein